MSVAAGTKHQTRDISSWLTHKTLTTGQVPSPACISKEFDISKASGYRWHDWGRKQFKPIKDDEAANQPQASVIERADRPSGVESTDFEQNAIPCMCGAQPLMTNSCGTYYLSCPPCLARGHRFDKAELAIAQWNAMIYTVRKPS